MDVELHPEAEQEVLDIVVRYIDAEATEAASTFLDQVQVALTKIGAAPERWPPYLHGTRRLVLRRFPYGVVYRVRAADVLVLAIASDKQRPGYWRRR